MRIEGQRIPFNFLLIISHKYPAIAKRCTLLYLLPIFAPPSLLLLITSWYTVIGGDDLHTEEKGDTMMVVVQTEERGDTM